MPLSVRQECTVERKSQNDFHGDTRVGFVEESLKENFEGGLKAKEDERLQVISLGGSYEICRRKLSILPDGSWDLIVRTRVKSVQRADSN